MVWRPPLPDPGVITEDGPQGTVLRLGRGHDLMGGNNVLNRHIDSERPGPVS